MSISPSAQQGSFERTPLYQLPVVGPKLQAVRDATEALRPKEDDDVPTVVAKRVVQASVIMAAAGATAVAVL